MSYKFSQRHRPDNNQKALVKLFVSVGGEWVSRANKPFDGWGWHRGFGGTNYLPIEIKNPDKEGHKDEYTQPQLKQMAKMRILGMKWLVWRTEQDVLNSVNVRIAE